ncbi:unnamed protein product [Malus baccata var. baccata]
MNTKFCYYNNYSLSQPRYFCKACRRYWTQGGTLRNVPVGGGCRKGKRPKGGSSSASASRTVQPQPSQKEQDMQNNLGIGGGSVGMSTANPSGGLAIHHQYYPGSSHGYLSSFAGLQSLSQSQPFNVGGGHDPASNMSLLQGFNLSVPMVALQLQQRQQFFQVSGARSNSLLDQAALYPSEHDLWAPQSVVNRSSVLKKNRKSKKTVLEQKARCNASTEERRESRHGLIPFETTPSTFYRTTRRQYKRLNPKPSPLG